MQPLRKWAGLRLELAEYVRDNNIPENDFRFLGIYEWQNVYDRLLEHFVDEQYARKCGLHWANINGGFREDVDRIYTFQMGVSNNRSYEWIEGLPEIAGCEKVYLFLEDEWLPKYWVAEADPATVPRIIYETYSDYYITDKKFNWLITENHHDLIQFIGKGLDLETVRRVSRLPDQGLVSD